MPINDEVEFNVTVGRYISVSLALLYCAISIMPECEFMTPLCSMYQDYRSIVASMGRLVPPAPKKILDDFKFKLICGDAGKR
jgi:hypothetical protein